MPPIDPPVLETMRKRVADLEPYRIGIQPAQPASLPQFLTTEHTKVATTIRSLIQVFKDIDERLAALE